MKTILIFLFFSSTFLFAQEVDSLNANPAWDIIDGVYLNHQLSCDFDSIAVLYPNTNLVMDSSSNHRFETGSKTYLEIVVRTKNCRCKDCSFYEGVMIDVSNLKCDSTLVLSSENTLWKRWNSWIIPGPVDGFEGTVCIENGIVSLVLFEYIDDSKQHATKELDYRMRLR